MQMRPETKLKETIATNDIKYTLFQRLIQNENTPLLLIAFSYFVFLISLSFLSQYGYFRDEFYYLACAKRLAFGYVDHPPLAPFLLWLNGLLFGNSLTAIRLLPALAGAATIYLTGLVTRELGGNRFSQTLAAVAMAIVPVFLVINSFYSMNTFEPLIMIACILLFIKIISENQPRYWLWIGPLAGIGLLNKHTFAVYLAILLVAMLLTPLRKYYKTKEFWLGGLIALIVFAPNLIWQIQNHLISLEFYRNINIYKNVPTPPLPFIMTQILSYHPFTFPIWLAGLGYFFFLTKGKPYRSFGYLFLFTFLFFLLSGSSRPDRVGPVYPVTFAGGAILIESWFNKLRWLWLKVTAIAFLIIGGLIIALTVMPVLSPPQLVKYNQALGLGPQQFEVGQRPEIPQLLADRLGWEKMAQDMSQALQQLSLKEKSQAIIFASNYGEAGALEFYGPKYGLPRVISGHNSYWLWGYGKQAATVVITIGIPKEDLLKAFESVAYSGVIHTYKYAMAYENQLPIYICRKPRQPMTEIWGKVKVFR